MVPGAARSPLAGPAFVIAATLMVKIAADTADFHRSMQNSQNAVRGTAQQMEQASSAVTVLQTRMRTLTESYRIGRLSEAQYAEALRTLRADVAELGTTTELTARSQQRLAMVGQSAARQLRAVTADARRGASGFEAFGVAALAGSQLATQGFRGVASAAGTLQVFAMGNPWLIGILSGIGAIASAWMLFSRETDQATEAVRELTREQLKQQALNLALAASRERDPIRQAQLRGGAAIAGIHADFLARRAELQALFTDLDRTGGAGPAPSGPNRAARNRITEGMGPALTNLEPLDRGWQRAMESAGQARTAMLGDMAAIADGMESEALRVAAGMDPAIQGILAMTVAMERAQERAELMGQALGQGMTAGIEAAISGGHVLQSVLRGTLQAISREASVRAALEVAKGVAALAVGNVAGAGLHFQAAGLFAAVGIGAGAAANAVGGGGGGGGRGGATSGAGFGSSPGATGEQGGTLIIRIGRDERASFEDLDELVALLNEGRNRRIILEPAD